MKLQKKPFHRRRYHHVEQEPTCADVLGYGEAYDTSSAGVPSQDYRYESLRNDRFYSSNRYFSERNAGPPMKDRWRLEGEHCDKDYYSSRGSSHQDRRPLRNRHPKPVPANRGHFEEDLFQSRTARGRGYSPEPRNYSRLPSLSPRRSPRYTAPGRSRFEDPWDYPTRDLSPSRFAKRRRTRSPSPAGWNRTLSPRRQNSSRSRSRGGYDSRNSRPASSRAHSPRKPSPVRSSRPTSRGPPSELDSYVPTRQYREVTPPPPERLRSGRSQTTYQRGRGTAPRRRLAASPSFRGRPRPVSPGQFRELSPYSAQNFESRYPSEDRSYNFQKKPYSRTPSIAGDWDRESMDVPYTGRGSHGNSNYNMRGRGQRPYNNNRGQYHGSPPYSTPSNSYHGSPPHSNSSFHRGRGGWDGPQQHSSHSGQHSPPFRQNSYPGAGQSQEEYFQSQQQQSQGNHPHPNHQKRPFRGNRGGYRGNFQQQGQDRRFSGPEQQDHGPPQRGRGSHYNNLQWTASAPKRGGGPDKPATGPNSIHPSQSLSYKGSRASIGQQDEANLYRSPREMQTEDERDLDSKSERGMHQKDASKISFAFKSKPPPQAHPKPPPDLNAKARATPDHRPTPTHPKGKFFDKKNQKLHERNERGNNFDNAGRPPPHGPQQHRSQHPYADSRGRSRSPPPKRLKHEPKPRPKLSPELAASESVYHRKPGNESVIGAGTYGKVFKAIHIYTKYQVALKKIRMEGERDGFPITAVREIKLLQNLRHKHVVALQEVMVEKNECFMVFEYMSHDLTGLINHPTFKLSPAHKKDLGRQMFEGLEFLHRRGVMHRDIKAANLLISHNGQLKYADFGLARFYTKSRQLDYTNRVITIWYRPPELLLGETQYGPSVDIWSAACVFMEMFTKKAIFPGEGGELSQIEKVYSVLGTPSRNEWPGIVDLPWYELMQLPERRKRVFETNFEPILSPAALELVRSIFNYDPAQRPNAEEVLQHPYFTEEEPAAQQAYELADVGGDWHEYESKAHRRENERREKERKKEEYVREREKRKAKEAGLDTSSTGNDAKKLRPESVELESGREDPPPPPQDERAEESDGEGSARMSMS